MGGGIDSYFEYLVKGSIMLHNPRLLQMFKSELASLELNYFPTSEPGQKKQDSGF